MTNEQTVIQIMKLDQTGFGGMTKEGEAMLQQMIEATLTAEQRKADTAKEYSYLYTRLIPSSNKARTSVK